MFCVYTSNWCVSKCCAKDFSEVIMSGSECAECKRLMNKCFRVFSHFLWSLRVFRECVWQLYVSVRIMCVCFKLTCCLSCCINLSFSRFSDITSSWVFFLLEEESSRRAMLASFSLMAASRACCLHTHTESQRQDQKKLAKCLCCHCLKD